MSYKVGDMVRVKESLIGDREYGLTYFNPEMEVYRGKVYRIRRVFTVDDEKRYELENVSRQLSITMTQVYWQWNDEMLSHATNPHSYKADISSIKKASEAFFELIK